MADPEHLKILRRGTDAWNLWRRKHRAVQPDLSRADLRDANLRAANLNSVNLSYANLEGANLGRAYLESAELHGATPRRAHLFEADLGHADLSEMDLREAELWHARLEGANLRRARLTGADLRHSDLRRADLRDCDLAHTNLTGTRLLRTDLRAADLREADLQGAQLWKCRLEEADLAGARVGHTTFGAIDLSRTSGLAQIRHEQPSSIGVDTLDLTAAGLRRIATDRSRLDEVETFLRYGGVREAYLDLLRRRVADAAGSRQTGSVFIRHSLADRAFARRLHAGLQARGIRCWLNEHPMLPGDDFESIDLGPSDRLLLCCSQAALTSWWMQSELEHADAVEAMLAERREPDGQALVPVNLDGYLGSGKWKSARGPAISARLAADFEGWEADDALFERALERVVAALE